MVLKFNSTLSAACLTLTAFLPLTVNAFIQDDDFGSQVIKSQAAYMAKNNQFLQLNPNISEIEYRTFDIKKIKLNKAKIKFKLPTGEQLEFTKTQLASTKNSGVLWQGVSQSGSELTFTLNNESLHGVILHQGDIYNITKISDKHYAVYKTNQEALPAQEEPDYIGEPDPSVESLDFSGAQTTTETTPSSANSGHAQIKMLAVYGPEVRDMMGGDSNLKSRLDIMVNQITTAFKNNGVDSQVSVELVSASFIDYQEGSGHSSIISDIKGMTEVDNLRDYYQADVVAIMVANSQYCGMANRIAAEKDSSYFTIYASCLKYTFPHELGHLLGMRHNPEQDSRGTFSHGYLDKVNKFRTIMSYNDNGCCDRIPYFSTPEQYHEGNVIGSADKHDNKRQLLSYAPKMADFYVDAGGGNLEAPVANAYTLGCYGLNGISWTQVFGDTNEMTTYNLYRGTSMSMDNKWLVTSTYYTTEYVNINDENDAPYFAVEACNSNGCSALSRYVKAEYLYNCQ
ncbi:M12 family metallo-peptidase [Thalassotalea ganghwensis]